MAVVALYNLKGGVGKTTAAVNLADLAARRGRRTLLWDLDVQGAASYVLGVPPGKRGSLDDLLRGDRDLRRLVSPTAVAGLSVIPADPSYRRFDVALDGRKRGSRRLSRLLEPLLEEYDDVFLDCPPTSSLLGKAVTRAADLVLAPLVPSPLSVRAFDTLSRLAEGRPSSPLVRGFFCMVDGRRRLHRELTERLPGRWPGILSARIPASADVERMASVRAPLSAFAAGSRAAIAFEALSSEVRAGIEEPAPA